MQLRILISLHTNIDKSQEEEKIKLAAKYMWTWKWNSFPMKNLKFFRKFEVSYILNLAKIGWPLQVCRTNPVETFNERVLNTVESCTCEYVTLH